MFLLPAISAWISDGLILYIYFSSRGGSGGHVTNNNDPGGLTVCGNLMAPCRRLRALHEGSKSTALQQRRSTLSSFPSLPGDDIDSDEVQDNTVSFPTGALDHNDESQQSSLAPEHESSKSANDTDGHAESEKMGISAATVEQHTRYLSILAIIRLILLTFPLSYAAYSGTRVPCAIAQYIFLGLSAMIVVSHMLAVLILDVPGDTVDPTGGRGDPLGGKDKTTGSAEDASDYEVAWTLLSLSLVSILLHFLVVLHVRSTAPALEGLYEEKRKRKRMAYAMSAPQSNGANGSHAENMLHTNGHHDDDDEELADETRLPLLETGNINRTKSFKEKFLCLPDQYEVFVSDTQARFDAARRMWADRLDIMTRSLQQNNINTSYHGEGRAPTSPLESPTRNLESSNLLTNAISTAATNATKLVKPDPFKVLLQLFAYEDVWSGTHNRLDLAFAADPAEGSAALSFYAPQLLSFLLHGAYFDISSKLEDWILKKCSEDLHFAHRCFWFLRSWCLASSSVGRTTSHAHSISSSSLGVSVGEIDVSGLDTDVRSQQGTALNQLRGVESNLYLSSCQGLPAPPLFRYDDSTSNGADPPGLSAWEYSGGEGYRESTASKFSPDEQILIERLLHRVVERGIRPATAVQYGSIDGRVVDDYSSGDSSLSSSPSALATAVEQGLVPVDPRTGFHSTAHLDCITAAHKHGFLPLDNAGEPYQNPSNDGATLFFAAPVFLDALLSIADDLMDTSKSNRTVELRQRLRSLEVELLPSNVVYLPIQNMRHRVWRIVSDESLALSTNERVPCIVTLEVIDCGGPQQQSNTHHSNENAVTAAWVSTPRHPHRHSTLLDKVGSQFQEGLKRLEDTLDHMSHHGDGKSSGLERRINDFWGGREGSRNKTAPLYTTVGSADADDQYSRDEEALALEGRELGELKASSRSLPKEEDDAMLRSCPPPPLGSPLKSDNIDVAPETPRPRSPSTVENSVVQGSPMGQWATPKKKSFRLRKRHMSSSIDDISEEEESEEDLSPQAKQRKRVVFPPPMASMSRSDSDSDEPETASPAEPDDSSDYDAIVTNGVAPAVVFKEDWHAKTERLRKSSVYGSHPGWRLLPILVKSNDDLRQEQLASQLIKRMALILAKARVPVWLYPYEIIAVTGRGGIIECVPDTISLDSLKRNDPDFTNLKSFFQQHFGRLGSDELSNAKACFVESLAAYSIVCYLLQIKDRHNGNILLTNKGHLVHIDFGFFFLSSPGKNSGFESAPFKLTRDFVNLMDGPDSRTFQKFRELCFKCFIELRKHCYQIILLVEMLTEGNEDLACFLGQPERAVMELKQRFRLDLNDNGIRKYVDSLIDESLENWRTRWYDRYQRFCVGVL